MQDNEGKIRVGITIGDINGVGPEVVIKTFSDSRMSHVCTPVIYASNKSISHYRKLLNANDFNFNTIKSVNDIIWRKVNLINCWEEEIAIEPGQATTDGGKYAFKSLEQATADLLLQKIDVLVTAPINKQNIQSPDFNFPGHTEYLAKAANASDALMMLVSDDMRVACATGHMALRDVAAKITKQNILKKLSLLSESLKKDFGIRKPKIAVLGLNPHAGDQGLLGKEEQEIIIPAIKEAINKNIMAYGAYAADGFFASLQHRKFDAVLAMYHDQGLIPFKSAGFEKGINFTAGLSFIRTSPDHGTAYDIAGKNIANESSFRQAIYSAIDIFKARAQHAEINKNPLAFSKKGSDH
ncbi:MAG: 4-hydroxythreonine-4-phosphate dehydrogenase PdxA [Bacteroidetes bacterium]|nr:4-hydroxythreonine-4-phosphate dehydrogenase PdxA [Bacteroidota bacterium]